jgi:hypothetical protein
MLRVRQDALPLRGPGPHRHPYDLIIKAGETENL